MTETMLVPTVFKKLAESWILKKRINWRSYRLPHCSFLSVDTPSDSDSSVRKLDYSDRMAIQDKG
jgi:hypothetical protein